MMSLAALRQDFPLLTRPEDERPVYFDNACVTLKPEPVIQAVTEYYRDYPACGERSVHRLSNRVTLAVDRARERLAALVNAPAAHQVVFTKNATESINHVAWGLPMERGDVVLTSDKEHNSNLVPWLRRAELEGTRHAFFATTQDGAFDAEAYKEAISSHKGRLRLVAVHQTSNLDGQTLPIAEMTEIAHDAGARVLVDGAQSVPHLPVDIAQLGVDYLAWSVHKMMGPSGVGCLYGTDEALRILRPRFLGGNTVAETRLDGFTLLDPPHTFEAGLQDYAGMIGAGAAADYLMRLGPADIHEHVVGLNRHLTDGLHERDLAVVHGPQDPTLRGSIVPFTVPGLDSHDVALYLDEKANICIRSGAHCVHSWLNARGAGGWARASLYAYNTEEECDLFLDALATLKTHLEAA